MPYFGIPQMPRSAYVGSPRFHQPVPFSYQPGVAYPPYGWVVIYQCLVWLTKYLNCSLCLFCFGCQSRDYSSWILHFVKNHLIQCFSIDLFPGAKVTQTPHYLWIGGFISDSSKNNLCCNWKLEECDRSSWFFGLATLSCLSELRRSLFRNLSDVYSNKLFSKKEAEVL